MIEPLCERFGIEGRVRAAAIAAYARVRDVQYPAQETVAVNVLRAFVDQGIVESDLAATTGYGYDDAARGAYESLLCRVFGTQRALARLSIVSGTHAIVTALRACTPPGKALLSVSGAPYDTLRNAICDAPHALVSGGVRYHEVPLKARGELDFDAIGAALRQSDVATVFVQRSRGYAPRRSLSVAQCESAAAFVKERAPAAAVVVDDCYGELVEEREPTRGIDLLAGSLIKNVGGSIAPAGGYVTGRAEMVDRVAATLFAPGLGDALGPSLGFGRALVQGLFLAPQTVAQTLRGLDFWAALFETLGFDVDPRAAESRTDIVQAIALGSAARVRRFAAGLQAALPLNARFRPEPGPVPGYAEPVVMSSGAFVAGSTLELSCDAPLRPPFEVYVQGGVS
ncbi:MAG: methionine gamma-lyase family protein, partial [Candidatus Eremiobacteraeota bacterium]|nr:methionine gamma-lyase family protein [Candidatus Eremiobacteraeota bacterium]